MSLRMLGGATIGGFTIFSSAWPKRLCRICRPFTSGSASMPGERPHTSLPTRCQRGHIAGKVSKPDTDSRLSSAPVFS